MRSVARRPRTSRAEIDLHMTPHPLSDSGRTPLRWTNVALDTFWNEHTDWVQALPAEGPHYAVPGAALHGPALERIFGAELAIERDFTRLCDEHGIIGVWGHRTIAGPSTVTSSRTGRSNSTPRCSPSSTGTPGKSR